MKMFGKDIAPLGMGCWPIGGEMYREGQTVGYSRTDDAESLRTIHAALDHGVGLFDTAAAYGAGHAEKLLGQALKGRDAVVVSKFGIAIDEDTKALLGAEMEPAAIRKAIDDSLRRLDRDCVDVMLLHLNELEVSAAEPMFAVLSEAVAAGKVGHFGWSTDFPDKARAFANQPGFDCVEHAMNLYFDAPSIQQTVSETGLVALIRSPLAMGMLTGKYGANDVLPPDDIRSTDEPWRDYFEKGRAKPEHLEILDAVRELLQTGGRTLTQGALCWLWGKREENVPVPGARTVAQMVDNAGALAFGALPTDVMDEIETLVGQTEQAPRALRSVGATRRAPEGDARAR